MIKSKYHGRPIIMSQMRNMEVLAVMVDGNKREDIQKYCVNI